jgi:adenine-specific DNA-methyltransferase
VLSQVEVDALRLAPNEKELLKPYYTSKQIKRYAADPSNADWIIYTDSRFRNPDSMASFPSLKRHLDHFSEVITSSNWPYGLHRSRKEKFFKGQKILALRKSVGRPIFSYVDFDCYVSATWYVIKPSKVEVKYLTGLLNSKLMAFWLKNKGKMQGSNFQMDKEPLLAIPIATSNSAIQIQIAGKVNEIHDHPQLADDLELEIDRLVYQLYDLTDDEIEIVKSM